MRVYPTVDESLDRLHRAGWSVGEYGAVTRWVVSGSNGDELRTRDPGFVGPSR